MKYVAPEFEIIRFGEEDVITWSFEDYCSVVETERIEDGDYTCEAVSVCYEFDNEAAIADYEAEYGPLQ